MVPKKWLYHSPGTAVRNRSRTIASGRPIWGYRSALRGTAVTLAAVARSAGVTTAMT